MHKNFRIPGKLDEEGTLAHALNEKAWEAKKDLNTFMLETLANAINFKGKL